MNAVRRKLNSSSGASILMALLLLLVAVMVSAVILAAAVSAAKTIRTDREQQQTYLTVSSAAALVRDSILNGSGKYVTKKTEYFSDADRKIPQGNPTTTVTKASGNFSSIMNDGISILKTQPLFPYSYTCTIQDENKQYEPVTAVFSLTTRNSEADGQISYLLTVTFTAGSDNHPCKMMLNMVGTESSISVYEESDWYQRYYKTITTTTIDWTQISPVISRERVTSN